MYTFIQPGDVVRGPVVLYKEILVQGKWMPVDYDYQSERL